MRSVLPLAMFAFASSVAAASPFDEVSVDDALAHEGLVVFEIGRPGVCEDDGWKHPKAGDWVGESGLNVYIGRASKPDDARRLIGDSMEVVPMRIAYRDGVEVDRQCGCADSRQLHAWFKALRQNKTLAQLTIEEQGLRNPDNFQLQAELDVIQLSRCANRPAEAMEGAMYLWNTIPTAAPEHWMNRYIRVGHDMATIAKDAPEQAEAIVGLRDGLETAKDSDANAMNDWLALNRILNDEDRIVSWYDAARKDASKAEMVKQASHNVFTLLMERERYADAGGLIDDPLAWLERWVTEPGGNKTAIRGYGALLAAGKHREAKTLADNMSVDGPAACAMLDVSVSYGAVHGSQKPLTKACDQQGSVDAWNAALKGN